MGRPTKEASGQNAAFGFGPLRKYWRDINRRERQAKAIQRSERKAIDKKRPKCKCAAYPWPHRPAGGFCRHPEPPLQQWQPKPGSRLYKKRYAGLLRQIARANGMHPIRDRAAIEAYMPQALAQAKQLKKKAPRIKYRNMRIIENGVEGYWTTAGPTM